MAKKISKPKCVYCGDIDTEKLCIVCKKIATECRDCHLEKHHNIIRDQNIHIVGGGGSSKTDGLDNDPDAFAPSWKADN